MGNELQRKPSIQFWGSHAQPNQRTDKDCSGQVLGSAIIDSAF